MTNAPNPFHFSQNSCIGAFGPFLYCTKVDAKLAELVPLTQKCAKQTRIRIVCNKRTRYTPLDPKLMFWVDAKLVEHAPLTHKFAKHSRVRIFRNERTQSTPFQPKHMFWVVSDRYVTAQKWMQNWPYWCH
jgi:hypothetical protein